MSESLRFHWADYLVFVIVLVISACIGIFYGWRDRKKKTVENYLLAGQNMSILPVSVSLFVSWTSAISFLSDPVQVYSYGLVYWFIGIGYSLAIIPVAHYFGPKLHKMKVISANEFIKVRFNTPLQVVVSIAYTITTLMFLGIALFAPSLALSQVTELEVWMSILIVGAVGTFYTGLGGMKAVLWADTVQCFIMVGGMLAVIIRGFMDQGGIMRVWEVAERGGRINLDKIDPNPLQSGTVWTFLVGGFFRVMNPYASSQAFIQRYSSLPTEKSVKIALYINLPIYFIIVTLFSLTGLLLYAFYHDCDPLMNGQITKSDQMVPLLTMQVLGFLPGLPGLFMACIFSACLSSVSSFQPALAAIWLRDIIMPLYKHHNGKTMEPILCSYVSKGLSIFCGLLTMALAYLLLQTGDSDLFQLSNAIVGTIAAPMAGLFMMGLVFSFINTFSALGGALISISMTLWLTIGAMIHPNTGDHLSFSTDGCPSENASWITTTASTEGFSTQSLDNNTSTGFQITDLYKLPSLMYHMLGPVVTVVASFTLYALYKVFTCSWCQKSQSFSIPNDTNNVECNEISYIKEPKTIEAVNNIGYESYGDQ